MSWACLQLGSREHYAVPLALHQAGSLSALLADTWVTPAESRLLRPVAPSLAARRHDGIPDRLVRRANLGRFLYESRVRLQKLDSWQACMLRITWFGQWCARELEKVEAQTVFSYSYNARWPFRVAKKRGLRTVLDLIDLGWLEEELTQRVAAQYMDLAIHETPAPPEYWEGLREEIGLADRIVVNSAWSKTTWIEAGVPAEKMVEIPLVYAPLARDGQWQMEDGKACRLATCHLSPATGARLSALFLGSVILRKGVGQLFDAMRQLKNERVDFTFAGPMGVRVPDDIRVMAHVRFLGPVDKATASRLYNESDVFLFPTLSDGFGLTQLEALGHGLPVISSLHCGQVVEHGISGLILPEVTPTAIAEAIMELVRDRDLLAQLKSGARVPDKCHPRHLAPALLALGRKEKKLKG
jgi:glycosyltransferase involved in cell wall biosynthesis